MNTFLTEIIVKLEADYFDKECDGYIIKAPKFGKTMKYKAMDFIRIECPYTVVIIPKNNGFLIEFRNRNYQPIMNYIETNALLLEDIRECLPKNSMGSYYFYNDGTQPYRDKKQLKKYVNNLKSLLKLYN